MITGIGIDMIELQRIQQQIEKNNKLIQRILTADEESVFWDLAQQRKVEFLAGRFAAKEAYAKAKGTGIGKEVSWQSINVKAEETGQPVMDVVGETHQIHVSLSHSRTHAVAQVILESVNV